MRQDLAPAGYGGFLHNSEPKDQLRQAAAMQEQRRISDVIIRQRERTVPGPKASSYGPFPGKTVYMGPRYLPGRLPNPANVVLV